MLEGLWDRESFTHCWLGMETGVSNTEFGVGGSQIPSKKTAQLCHSWGQTRGVLGQHTTEKLAHQCALLHYTQQLRNGTSLDAHHHING